MKTVACEGFEQVWSLAYYFKYGTSDYLPYQFMDFKASKELQVKAFSRLARNELGKLGQKFDYITRSLGSKELTATQSNSVRTLALEVKEEIGGLYSPNLVKKNRATKEMKTLSKDARKKELEGVYELYLPKDLNNPSC